MAIDHFGPYESITYAGTPWTDSAGRLHTNDRTVRLMRIGHEGDCDYVYRIPEDCRPLPICPGCGAWVK